MSDATIRCPQCQSEIKLTESLAAPLLEATRKQFEQRIAQKDAEIRHREEAIRAEKTAIERARQSIDEQVAARLKTERAAIATDEAKKARQALADDLVRLEQEKAASDELLKQRDAKLQEAQKNELSLRRERQILLEEKERFELDKQRAIDAERLKIREAALKDADEQSRLRIAEKDKTISDLQSKLQDALRKAEQGSQQLQGEVLELELEALLRAKFPRDTIEPVAKGEHGGDMLQRVCGSAGQPCGTILWESKRTKNWSDGWLAKLRSDQRAAKAEVAVIVSQALPKELETFGEIDGVWVTCSRTVIPLAVALRQQLSEVALARQSSEGQQTKMEMIYRYLTGPRFRQRVQAIVEKFNDMQEDLEKEKKYLLKQWAKRAEQIHCVLESTAGMYGDLQGIAGKTLQEIEGLTSPVPELEPPLLKRLAAGESRRSGADACEQSAF
jgi:hypothetical protein